jgi:hypothetical protein
MKTNQEIANEIRVELLAAVVRLGCPEAVTCVQTRDTDLSPLFQDVGEHFAFSITGIIKKKDFEQAHK